MSTNVSKKTASSREQAWLGRRQRASATDANRASEQGKAAHRLNIGWLAAFLSELGGAAPHSVGSKPNVWVRPRRDAAAAAARVSLYVHTVSRVPPFVRWISSPSGSASSMCSAANSTASRKLALS